MGKKLLCQPWRSNPFDRKNRGSRFPNLKPMREYHQSTEFARACRRLKITGISLHSYRYAWAERARS
jgi:hypothetical protein